jgi:hypothetical protein
LERRFIDCFHLCKSGERIALDGDGQASGLIVGEKVAVKRRWTAIETAAEATKLSELSMERVTRRLGERAGHNVSER